MQQRSGQRDVGPPPDRIILRQRLEYDWRRGAGDSQDLVGQVKQSDLGGVAEVDWTGRTGSLQRKYRPHLIVDVAETPRLGSVAVHSERSALECLGQQAGNHPSVTRSQPGPVSVEDPRYPHVEAEGAVIGHGHRLGEALSLVIYAAEPNRVHMAPVILGLRMDLRIPVDLASGCEHEPGPLSLGQLQAVAGAQASRGQRLDGMPQIGAR
jgi:hypothetical protein